MFGLIQIIPTLAQVFSLNTYKYCPQLTGRYRSHVRREVRKLAVLVNSCLEVGQKSAVCYLQIYTDIYRTEALCRPHLTV